MLLNPDFKDILSEFIAADVEFLVVGAYAVAAHGIPRATGDLDHWVNCSDQNTGNVLAALKMSGAPMDEVSRADFAEPGITFQMGMPPNRALIKAPTQTDLLRGLDAS
jgi:hypothetical protein